MPRKVPPYGPVIRYLREARGWTPQQLGLRIGEADYYIGYLENGFRWPRPQQLERLARAFAWEVFELALVADVEIPYPDWPRLDDLAAWRQLAHDWTVIADAITRYALARELFGRRDWQAAVESRLPALTEEYGFVACYDWIRRHWTPHRPHPARLGAIHSVDELRQALQAATAGSEIVREPGFLEGLDPADRAAVEAVARSLRAQRRRS